MSEDKKICANIKASSYYITYSCPDRRHNYKTCNVKNQMIFVTIILTAEDSNDDLETN